MPQSKPIPTVQVYCGDCGQPLPEREPKLTPKQRIFVDETIANPKAPQYKAAETAGLASPHVAASLMIRNPKIQQAIAIRARRKADKAKSILSLSKAKVKEALQQPGNEDYALRAMAVASKVLADTGHGAEDEDDSAERADLLRWGMRIQANAIEYALRSPDRAKRLAAQLAAQGRSMDTTPRK